MWELMGELSIDEKKFVDRLFSDKYGEMWKLVYVHYNDVEFENMINHRDFRINCTKALNRAGIENAEQKYKKGKEKYEEDKC